MFNRIINAVNSVAKNAAVAPIGKLPPPPPIDTITPQGTMNTVTNTLTCSVEILHYTMTHNQALQKGVQYISEIGTDPNFSATPHVIDHGASRSAFVPLPTNDSKGNLQTYYLRSMAQYHGSDTSKPTVLGQSGAATKIVMSGTSAATLLPSQGSGTAKIGQGGQGLGNILNRPAPGPKRNLT